MRKALWVSIIVLSGCAICVQRVASEEGAGSLSTTAFDVEAAMNGGEAGDE